MVMPPLDAEFFGGRNQLDIEASSIFQLVGALDEIAPGFAEVADVRAAFAVDGVLGSDWSAPLAGAGEVLIVPRIGGG